MALHALLQTLLSAYQGAVTGTMSDVCDKCTCLAGTARACVPVILQVELAYLLKEAAILTLPLQIIHLLSSHGAFMRHI